MEKEAETKTEQTATENPEEVEKPGGTPENKEGEKGGDVTVEELMAKIAQLETQSSKNKAALDKALKEKGEITKKYRATLTEAEQAKIAKEEEDEERKAYVSGLEEFKRKTEAKERYLMQGMTVEMAEKAAEAEVSNDMDSLASIQKQHTEALIKAKEAEWQKNAPQINAGTGEQDKEKDAFLSGFNSVKPVYGTK